MHQHWGVLSSERKPELPTRQPCVLSMGPGTLRSFRVRFWGCPGTAVSPRGSCCLSDVGLSLLELFGLTLLDFDL